jgi:hypothetical protein
MGGARASPTAICLWIANACGEKARQGHANLCCHARLRLAHAGKGIPYGIRPRPTTLKAINSCLEKPMACGSNLFDKPRCLAEKTKPALSQQAPDLAQTHEEMKARHHQQPDQLKQETEKSKNMDIFQRNICKITKAIQINDKIIHL